MTKYCVVFCSYGYVYVDAVSEDEAIDKAYEVSTWDDFETPEYRRVELIEEGSDA